MPLRTRLAASSALISLCLLAGCGRPVPPVAGKVTRDGEPVPYGTVLLTPDIDKGSRGPSVILRVRDGEFSSSRDGMEVVAGEYQVLVSGAYPTPEGTPQIIQSSATATVPAGGTTDLAFDIGRAGKAAKPGR